MKKLTVNKGTLGKFAAYGAGAMVGGGLTWLGWRWLEKRGIDPLGLLKKKAVEGDRMYYDPANDPDLDIDALIPEEIDPEEDREEAEDDEPPGYSRNEFEEPYMIDEDTFDHSEEEGYGHNYLTFYAADGQMTDSNNEVLAVEPWRVIGVGNFEILCSRECEGEIYVRNENTKQDYVISKEEGYLND